MQATVPQLGAWSAYFASTASIAGALLGLVFVALTFNPEKRALGHDRGMRALAQQVFTDFLVAMVVALVMLVPEPGWRLLALMLAAIGAVGAGRVAYHAWQLRRSHSHARTLLLQRFGLSLVAHVFVAGAGLHFWLHRMITGEGVNLIWLGLLMLLMAGSRTAWLLVTENSD